MPTKIRVAAQLRARRWEEEAASRSVNNLAEHARSNSLLGTVRRPCSRQTTIGIFQMITSVTLRSQIDSLAAGVTNVPVYVSPMGLGTQAASPRTIQGPPSQVFGPLVELTWPWSEFYLHSGGAENASGDRPPEPWFAFVLRDARCTPKGHL